MIKDFQTYINEGLFDRNQSEFTIRKTDKGIEQIYIPKTRGELYEYIKLDIEKSKREGTYPNVNLNNIDVSEVAKLKNELEYLFGGFKDKFDIAPDISNWNIKYIPNNFFDTNKHINEFTIPNGVTRIGNEAFADCSNLTSVKIPNSVTSIGHYAFTVCTSLSSIVIPNRVTSIRECAFSGCDRLASVTIGNGVISIEESAFQDCKSLTSIVIGNKVTNIGKYAFYNCSSLTSVTIPNKVTSIGDYAFFDCNSLKSVTIPSHCNIDANSFPKKCKVTRRDD